MEILKNKELFSDFPLEKFSQSYGSWLVPYSALEGYYFWPKTVE